LWTLGQDLGEDFSDEVKKAWTAAYVILSAVMTDAAAKSAA